MNGFPYWQFHNERWLTGKVSSLDLDAQGLFLYFCMAAWASRGAFNICSTSVRLRFRKTAEWIADTLGTMVEIGILIEDGEKYRIKFIDEQIAEMNVMREKRSKAGKASAESRYNTRDEDNTKEEERKGKVTTVLESVQHGLNKCSTHVKHTPAPPSSSSSSLGEAIAADAAQAANAEPPVTRSEADARAAQAGVPPDLVERWWLFQQEQGWVNARGHRMSRDGAFASLMRWKISEHRFAQRDELTAKRIEAAEAIASRGGRNQASTSNLTRSGSEAVDRLVSSFRQMVAGIGKGSVYVEKAIRHDSAGLPKADAERLRAGYLSVMGGHPGCVEEPEAE